MRRFTAVLLSCVLASCLIYAVLVVRAPSAPAYPNGALGQAIVDEAYGWIGTPYGAYGVDCSGFTSQVFAQFGVYLPDDPAAQWSYGVPSTAEAGDLVFYNEHGYGISHVGIATGYGTVISLLHLLWGCG
jgi:cell wall-associated NlpC family hydrolase